MIDRAQVKAIAKRTLENNYWLAIGLLLLNSLVAGACGAIPYVGQLAAFFVVPIVVIGFNNCCLRMVRGEKVEVGQLFDGFQNYGHNLGGYWWMSLWTFLWTLLCYIPGIVKSFSYSQTLYILMDEPDIEATEALEKSKQMMEGHKMELFILYLSFFGWALLATITCGIVGIFYVYPYIALAGAAYYELLKKQCGLFYSVVNPVNNPTSGSDNGYNGFGTYASNETPAIPSDSVYEATSVKEFIKEDTNDDTVTSEEVDKFVNPIDAMIQEYDEVEKANNSENSSDSNSYDSFGDNNN